MAKPAPHTEFLTLPNSTGAGYETQDAAGRQRLACQSMGVLSVPVFQDCSHRDSMPMMQVQHGACHFTGGHPSYARNHPRHFAAEAAHEGTLGHVFQFESVTNEGLGHRLVEVLFPGPGEQIDLVHRLRVVLSNAGSERAETTVEALRTTAAMGVEPRHPINPAAANCMPG